MVFPRLGGGWKSCVEGGHPGFPTVYNERIADTELNAQLRNSDPKATTC